MVVAGSLVGLVGLVVFGDGAFVGCRSSTGTSTMADNTAVVDPRINNDATRYQLVVILDVNRNLAIDDAN